MPYEKTCTAETNPSLSGTPTFWTYQGNTHQLLFELPYGAGSVPFRFHITGDGMCQPKSLLFFAISDNKSAYSLTAEALPGSNQCTIRIEAGDAYPSPFSLSPLPLFLRFIAIFCSIIKY